MKNTRAPFFTKQTLQLVIVELILWIGAISAIIWLWDHWFLSGPHGPYRWVGMDFVPYWVGGREMLAGANPYSPETTLKIQQAVYGGPALGNDPMMFVYPAWILAVIAPFAVLPLHWAVALYAGTLLWALMNFIHILAAQWSGGQLYRKTFWVLLLTIGSLPFLIISVTKGQLGYLSLLALFISRKIWDRHPFWAGIVLGLAIMKPTVTIIPTAGFILWALLERNWKFLAGFASTMTILIGTSLVVAGNWLPGYIGMLKISGGAPVLWSLDILPWPWKAIFGGVFLGLLVHAFIASRRENDRRYWLSATVLAGIALFPMRWIYDLFLGILIPSEEKNLSGIFAITTGVAILAPWVLVVFPETTRWNVAVVGLPIIWTASFLANIFFGKQYV
jgi:hypothetical protein